MPEGDAVWRTAKRLHERLAGESLDCSDFRVPAYATVDLRGQMVDEVISRGKHLLMRVGSVTVHSHLAMEGAWHVYSPGARWRRPGHQARAVVATTSAQAVGFALGALDVVSRTRENEFVGHLGPDLLGSDWDLERALQNLRGDPDRPLGSALLDQRNLAGIGNIYRNEVCFVRGVDPRHRVVSVEGLEPVVDTARRILYANRDHAAIVTTGNVRRGEQTWVYGRAGQECRRCGTAIVRAYLGDGGDRERSIYVCPSCQR